MHPDGQGIHQSSEFQTHYLELLRSRLKVGFPLAIALVVGFGLSDWVFFETHLSWLLLLRLGCAAALAILMVLNLMWAHRVWQEGLTWAAALVLAAMLQVIIAVLGPDGAPTINALYLVIIGGMTLIPVRLQVGMGIAAGILTLYLATPLVAGFPLPRPEYFHYFWLLAMASAILVLANYLHHQTFLRQFGLRHLLEYNEQELRKVARLLEYEVRERTTALRQSEERYRTLVEHLPSLVFALNPQNEFSFVGPRSELLTGYQPVELEGKTFLELVHPDDQRLIDHVLQTVNQDGRPVSDLEFRLQRKDGEVRIFRAYTAPYRYPAGRIAGVIGTAMDVTRQVRLDEERKRYRQNLEEALARVQAANFDTVKALASAIEAKDYYTRGHADRVRILCLATARRMGLDEEQKTTLEYAAMLHDVGKIGVRGAVLNKLGPLNDQEYEYIKLHPGVGDAILEDIEQFAEVRTLVRAHHERIDGKGYPDGLKGDDIPLGARIMAVADSFDAMRSKRPYRDPIPLDEVLRRLRSGSGTQFDPLVLEFFLETIEQDTVLEEWSTLESLPNPNPRSGTR